MPYSIRHLVHLPSRIALLLGLGVFSVAGAEAGAIEVHPGHDATRVPQQSAKALGDLLIWSEAGRIYVSEAGGEPKELQLGDTAEAAQLRQLIEGQGATAATPHVLHDRIILVGGGGEGFHRDSDGQSNSSNKFHGPVINGADHTAADKAPPRQQVDANQQPSTTAGKDN